MRKLRSRRQITVDPSHMTMLHQEAVQQLELMTSLLQAAEHTADTGRDSLDRMTQRHWSAYLDLLHMLCSHDSVLAALMKKKSFLDVDLESAPEINIRRPNSWRLSLVYLLTALIKQHQHIQHIFAVRGHPWGDYLQESLTMEYEHMAGITAMVQELV